MYRLLQKEVDNAQSQKTHEFYAVGDLSGDHSLFTKRILNLSAQGAKIGKTPLVFLGDIIGDRREEGFDILIHIHRLREAILDEKSKELIQVLVGNHDLWIFMFFATAQDVRLIPENKIYQESKIQFFTFLLHTLNRQGRGINEFSQFLPLEPAYSKEFDAEKIGELFLNGPEILANMRKNRKGKILIEEFINMKLCSRIGNTIFFHTPPTQQAIGALEKANFDIDSMNTEWRQHAGNIFSGTQKNPIEDLHYFELLFDGLIDTDNRFKKAKENPGYAIFTKEQAQKLKDIGIDQIVFGHDFDSRGEQTVHGIRLVGVDYGMDDPNVFVQEKPEAPKKLSFSERVLKVVNG